jgi:hypothetical protein
LALGTVLAKSQQNVGVSHRHVKDVHIEADSMNVALQSLARQYKVVLGVDSSGARVPAPVRADVADGSLKDVLDALAASGPGYSWRTEDNGAVHFYNSEVSQRLSEVNVSRFSIKSAPQIRAFESIQQLPEVRHWVESAHCPLRSPIAIVGNPPDSDRGDITFQMSNVPLRKILDELAVRSEDYFWAVNRYELNGQCFTNIAF